MATSEETRTSNEPRKRSLETVLGSRGEQAPRVKENVKVPFSVTLRPELRPTLLVLWHRAATAGCLGLCCDMP